MRIQSGLFVSFALLGSGILFAQQPFTGLVEGYTFDAPTGSIRAVNGAVGSASLGGALWSGLEFGSVAPRRNYALAFGDNRCSVVSGLGSDPTSAVPLPGPCIAPEGVEWSGDASVAILYSRTDNWIRIVTGLPSAPVSGATLSLGMLGGRLSALASDTIAKRVAIGITGGSSDGVYQMSPADGNFVPVLPGAEPIALAFSGDGSTLYTIDGASHQVTEINVADSSSRSWNVSPIADPVSVGWGTDSNQRKLVYVVGRNDSSLAAFDASSHEMVSNLALSFQPTSMMPLGTNSFVLRPRAGSQDPLWALTNAPQQAVYFIPSTPISVREGRHK